MKKLAILLITFIFVITLAACGETVPVTFNQTGGVLHTPARVDVVRGQHVPLADATRFDATTGQNYRAVWTTSATGGNVWEFHRDTVQSRMTLYAQWVPVIFPVEGPMAADLNAVLQTTWSSVENLNPLHNINVAASDVFGWLRGSFFVTDYDWPAAIAAGYAAFVGDFSKVQAGTVSIEALGVTMRPSMATSLYMVNEGTDLMDANGNLDFAASRATRDNKFRLTLRDDLRFENGTPINAQTVLDTVRAYIDPLLRNARANFVVSASYLNLVKSNDFLVQGSDILDAEGNVIGQRPAVDFSEVGIRKVDDLVVEFETNAPMAHERFLSYLNLLFLIEQDQWEAALSADGRSTDFGTMEFIPLSFGPFTLQGGWELDQRFTLTRRNDYHATNEVPFAGITGPILTGANVQAIAREMFDAGTLDSLAVSSLIWSDFMHHPSLLMTPSAISMALMINLQRPEGATFNTTPLIQDQRFRTALYLATDRQDLTTNVLVPNLPSLGLLSNIHKVNSFAPGFYNETAARRAMLEDLGLSPGTWGFNQVEAKALFDAAYADAVANGLITAGSVQQIELAIWDSTNNRLLAEWLTATWGAIFGSTFELVVTYYSNDAAWTATRNAGDWDLLNGGLSGAHGISVQAIYWIWIENSTNIFMGNGWGPSYNPATHDGMFTDEIVVVPLTNLFNLVLDKVAAGTASEEDLAFLEMVDSTGVFTGTAWSLFNEIFEVYYGVDFDGSMDDLHQMIVAFERIALQHMIVIPTTVGAAATVFNPRNVIMPPAWSFNMVWGGLSYRYIKRTV